MFKKIFKIFLVNLILFIFFLILLSYPETIFAAGLKPTAEVSIPTVRLSDPYNCDKDSRIICIPWIAQYIVGIYKYGVGVAGILASIVLMWGGVIWLTAGGSQQRVTEAQSWIRGSIMGIIILLTSYLILFEINPGLVNLELIKINVVDGTAVSSSSAVSGVSKKDNPCTNASLSSAIVDNHIVYENITTGKHRQTPSGCDKINFNIPGASAEEARMLKAIASVESTCQPNQVSPKGACGLMQILPSTAQKYDSRATCEFLKSNPTISIEIALKFIKANQSAHGGKLNYIFAGYNAGYGTKTKDGKTPALAPSKQCSGYKAFECCKDPGGLDETQAYVYRALLFYNYTK